MAIAIVGRSARPARKHRQAVGDLLRGPDDFHDVRTQAANSGHQPSSQAVCGMFEIVARKHHPRTGGANRRLRLPALAASNSRST